MRLLAASTEGDGWSTRGNRPGQETSAALEVLVSGYLVRFGEMPINTDQNINLRRAVPGVMRRKRSDIVRRFKGIEVRLRKRVEN